MEDLPENDPLRESFEFFEEHLAGVRTFDLVVEVKDTTQTIFDYEVIRQIEKLSDFLKDEYQLKSLLGPALLVKQINQIETDGSFANYRIPDEDKYGRLKPLLTRVQKSKLYANIGTDDLKIARIVGSMKDEGAYINEQRNTRLMAFAEKECPDLKVEITGLAHLIDENNSYVTGSLLKSLMAALIVISVLMAFLYKSPKLILIAMLPNILPLFMITAVMYFIGIDLKIVTALIFTVAFGITVDDTIHLLGHLKLELDRGKSTAEALKETYLTTGKSIILTTVILFSGFIALAFSEFASSYYFGLLLSLELLFAVIVDLTLLPVLVLWFVKQKKAN
jgi:predicted RND superfamily exporter protein